MIKDKSISIKKWFHNYWYYYKIHSIAGVFILLVMIISISECVNRDEPDADVTYFGGNYFSEDFSNGFREALSPIIEDVNGNGKKTLVFTPLTIGENVKSEQDIAIRQKAQLIIAVGESYLYIMDKEIFEHYKEQDLFADISGYIGGNEPVYGFPASQSMILKKLGMKDSEQAYVALRVMTLGDEKKADKVAFYDNAVRILIELHKKD
mgnify:CR=1 FL=1